MERKLFTRLTPVEDALKIVASRLPRGVRAERMHIRDAWLHILAEDVYARVSYPPEPRSIVDGYAVRFKCVVNASEDNPVSLPVVERVRVGETPSKRIEGCEAIEVDTGAVIPHGADAVVPVEYTREEAGVVTVYRPVGFGENIAWPGSDVVEGECIARKGQLVTPQLIGAFAAAGVEYIRVYAKPRVCLVATGVELLELGEALTPGKVYEVNTKMLYSLLASEGFPATIYGIVPDDEEAIRKALHQCLGEHDVVIFTGGTSAGPYDIVYRVLDAEGELLIHGLKVKPGKPTAAAIVQGKLVLGLPGNPVSALNVYRIFARPLLWHLAGGSPPEYVGVMKAKLGAAAPTVRGRRLYQPVILAESNGTVYAYPVEFESYMIVTYSRSDGYIVVPEDRPEALQPNEDVEVHVMNAGWRTGCYAFGEELTTQIPDCKWIGGGTSLAVDALKKRVANIAIVSRLHPAAAKMEGIEGYEMSVARRRLVVAGKEAPKIVVTYSPATSLRFITMRVFSQAEHFVRARSSLMAALLVSTGVADAAVVLEEHAERFNLEVIDVLEEELVIFKRVGSAPVEAHHRR